MTDIYGDFEDSDDYEGNEDDIGGLSSILSWDDEDDAVQASISAASNALLSTTPLPELLSFPAKEGQKSTFPQLMFGGSNIQNAGQLAADGGTHAALSRTGGSAGSFKLQIPMPTPIEFRQTQQGTAEGDGSPHFAQQQTSHPSLIAPTPIAPSQQQGQQQTQQQHMVSQGGPTAVPQQASFSLYSQMQPPNIMPAANSSQNQQQQIQMQQAAMPGMALQQPMTQQVQSLQHNRQADQQQAHQQQQFALATDPNAFLRQLQVAQLQQQLNAVQQQQGLTSSSQVQQQPSMIQQIPFVQQQVLVPGVPNQAVGPTNKKRAPSQKKSPALKIPKTAPNTTAASATRRMQPVVSASDTDGEVSLKMRAKGSKPKAAADAKAKKAKAEQQQADMSHLTPEEKAKANRDRNREHARNTRLRKKAYLEKLKSTVDELCRERDTLVSERAGAASLLVEMHNTRTEVLMSFFALRSANEKRRDLWASILDESCFACVLPVTPYRSFPACEVQVSKCQRTILGIDGMMSDTASLHVLLNSLVDRSLHPHANVEFRYTLVTEESVVAGNQLMARWVMSTLNATRCGARMEVAKQGMLCCKFNSAHKIIGLELMFDVMAFMLQLKQAQGSDSFCVIPNTVQTCQRSFDRPMVMTISEAPYTIVQVNKLWEDMTGYKAEEVVGKTSCRVLQGKQTDKAGLEAVMQEIRFKRPASALITNYKKTGEMFHNYLLFFPLSTDSKITHYLALTGHVGPVGDIVDRNQEAPLPSKTMEHQPQPQQQQQIIGTVPNGMLKLPGDRGSAAGQASSQQMSMMGLPLQGSLETALVQQNGPAMVSHQTVLSTQCLATSTGQILPASGTAGPSLKSSTLLKTQTHQNEHLP